MKIQQATLPVFEFGRFCEYAPPMLKRVPFDPLKFLEHQLLLTVRLDEASTILVYGASSLAPRRQQQVTWIVRTHAGLLRLQLYAYRPELRPSVRKLMAQGKVEIVNERYRVKVRPSP
jgi:hypothetical protein